MEKEKIEKILELHKKWLKDEPSGIKADLHGANLQCADLHGASLRGANLRGANLQCANLNSAQLRYADLRGANLQGAGLISAILSGAKLSYAGLRGADLRYADLRGADLRGADLRGADLRGANLFFWTDLTDIRIDTFTTAVLQACPEEGSFTAYKKASGKIVVLEILADAKRSSATTLKCRCDKAKILRIEELDGTLSDTKEVASDYDKDFIYKVGEIVSVDNFDDNCWNECSQGIHFFINKELARQY